MHETQAKQREARAMRAISNHIRLWGLCGVRACRRARACHGDPRQCLSRYAPLLPEDVREGAMAFIEGWRLGLDFDEVFEQAPDEIEAYAEWLMLIERSATPRGKGGRARQ